MKLTRKLLACCAAAIVLLPAEPAVGQGRAKPPPLPGSAPVRVVLGPRYEAGGVHQFLLGSNWRAFWSTALVLPVLDLQEFSGGLTPERAGGGHQSLTLHFVDARGIGWIFRSVDKYPSVRVPGLEGTVAGWLVQDQISALHPAGALMIPPLLEAVGTLHVIPSLYVMPDDAALGEFRGEFAGMVGALEMKANEGPEDAPGFAGSRKVVDTEVLLANVRENAVHTVANREFLRTRLVDFIIGDTDRSGDNYRWARFPDSEGGYVWRPLPRDRDWAFHRPDGLLLDLIASSVFPKFVPYGPAHSSIRPHTQHSPAIDRVLLNELDRAAFDAEVANVQARLTNDVIESAVQRLPAEYPAAHADWIATSIELRRDSLADFASKFYGWLADVVDVHGTDEAERVEIVRRADGTVEVAFSHAIVAEENSDADSQSAPGSLEEQPARAGYRRVFQPTETSEIRVFLRGGDDVVVVRGPVGPITIRVIGGPGDDLLADSSFSRGVHLYDAEGENRIVRSAHTRTETRSWEAPRALHDIDWVPDWGSARSIRVALDYSDAAGVVIGAGPTWQSHGFRRLPYHWRVAAQARAGLAASHFGLELHGDYRFENAPHSIEVRTGWSSYDSFHWFGLGNDTETMDATATLIRLERLSVEPSFVWRFGRWRAVVADSAEPLPSVSLIDQSRPVPFRGSAAIGPVIRRTATVAAGRGPFTIEQPTGYEPLWQMGAGVNIELGLADRDPIPRRGFGLKTGFAAFPGVTRDQGASAQLKANLNAYIPLGYAGMHLAVRAGGVRAFGDFAAFDAASVGGRSTLRGFDSHRWAGDAAAYGGAELRAPLGTVKWIVPTDVGAFALLDAGRAWVDGSSPGGWHRGYGGGLWFETFGNVVSAAFARGERDRLYLWLGLPY